jgi:hypothetical protein
MTIHLSDRSVRPAALAVAALGFLVALVSLRIGFDFERGKYDRSGVPEFHHAARKGDHYFYVSRSLIRRGGPPLEHLPHVDISEAQYRLWKSNARQATLWEFVAVFSLIGAVGGLSRCARPADRTRRRSAASPRGPRVRIIQETWHGGR